MSKNLDESGLKSIVSEYDLFFIDIWGVVHNGIKLHENAVKVLNELSNSELVSSFSKILGINETSLDNLIERGLDPDTYIYTQCADAVRGVDGGSKVYMGIGIDAPRSSKEQAICTPDIAYRSVLATYKAGGEGIVLSPNYASMKLSNLDGVAKALKAVSYTHLRAHET